MTNRRVQPKVLAQAQVPFTIVGAGRIGQALFNMGNTGKDVIVERGEKVTSQEGPVIVCTRNDALDSVLEQTPENRRKDLVFIQNGMLQPYLESRGLQNNTQANIYFAVPKVGAPPIDGKTDLNPEGLTAVSGEHGQAFAERLKHGNLSCKVLNKTDFMLSMLEKLVWISGVMAIGQKYKASVGDVEQKYKKEVSNLLNELGKNGAQQLNIKFPENSVDKLNAYSRSVASYPTAVKEFQWRNGWFYNVSQNAIKNGQTDPFPTHTNLLKELNVV